MASNHKHLNGDIYIYILIYDIWRYMGIFTCSHFKELAEVLPAQPCGYVTILPPTNMTLVCAMMAGCATKMILIQRMRISQGI
jgi:hypothetical protein